MTRVLKFIIALAITGVFGAAAAYFAGYGPGATQQQKNKAAPIVAVIVEEVIRKPFVDQIEAIGTTYAKESVVLTASLTEHMVRINLKDGERVKKGDVLVELDTEVDKARLASAKALLEESGKQLERTQTLARRGITAETRLDERERTRDTSKADVARITAEIDRKIIKAPFDGVLGLKRISVGMLVQPGTELATLQDISVLKLDFTVPELYMTSLKQGQDIIARTAVYPNREFKGQIATVEKRVDAVTRAVTVRAMLPNKDSELAPGMLMTVNIIRERSMVLLIPEEAVVAIGEQRYVYKLEGGDKVKRVEIATGRRIPGFLEVTGGLNESDKIVVEGTIRVKDGSTVKPQPRNNAGSA